MTILHPERMPDIINTMLAIADEQGRLPVWHLWGNETDCMVGNPGIPVVADAIVKGIEGFDREPRLRGDPPHGDEPRPRQRPAHENTAISRATSSTRPWPTTWEYALADGAAARAAEALGRDDDARYFTERSHSYRHYFDPTTGFMRDATAAAGGDRPSIRSPRRTAPTTTAKETPGSTLGSHRTMSRGSKAASEAGPGCSKSWIRSSR